MDVTRRLWVLPAALLLGGCAAINTYLDAEDYTRAGGRQSQEIAAARTQLVTAQTQNVQLQDAKTQRERELERQAERIRAMEDDLSKQEAALTSALKASQVTQVRYTEIKRAMDSLLGEIKLVAMQNRGDALTPADPKADAAKETVLRDLERRKQELEGVLLAALPRR